MTTTFADIQLTEDIENYMYENKEYNFKQGDVISLPKHTANRFVNKWERAKWAKEPYEVKDSEYEAVVGRVRNSEGADGEKPKDLPDDIEDAESPTEFLESRTLDDLEVVLDEFGNVEADIGFLQAAQREAERQGAEELIEEKLDELQE